MHERLFCHDTGTHTKLQPVGRLVVSLTLMLMLLTVCHTGGR